MRGGFGRHRRELAAVFATALAAGGLLVLVAADPGADPIQAKSAPFQTVAPDLDALFAAKAGAVASIAATEHHIRHFEWGIGNLLRNISRLEFRADGLSDEIRQRRRTNKNIDDQQRELAQIEAMRLDYLGEIERAERAIAGLRGEISAHRHTVEAIDRLLDVSAPVAQ